MNLGGKKFLLLGIIVVLLASIPATLYLLQKRQEVRTGAVASTTLSFSPATKTAGLGDEVKLDIMVNPGQNQVSFVKLNISYDPTKLSTVENSLVPASAFPATLEGPTYTSGNIDASLSIGANPADVIQSPTKVANLTFKTLAITEGSPTQISFGSQTQVLSIAQTDLASENVLSNTSPALITINPAGAVTVTPTITITTTPSATGPAGQNLAPTCTALNVDRITSGTAPFPITFTANGSDSDGTISKVKFNFGDGPVTDVTTAGGIGTNNVSVQTAHTYNNPGTYTASAIFTDDKGAVSTLTDTCKQTITVAGTTPQPTVAASTPIPTLPPAGPDGKVLGVGIAGIILSILGGILFFAL